MCELWADPTNTDSPTQRILTFTKPWQAPLNKASTQQRPKGRTKREDPSPSHKNKTQTGSQGEQRNRLCS
jgi:hypothetical protein